VKKEEHVMAEGMGGRRVRAARCGEEAL